MTNEEAIARIKNHKIVHKMFEPRAIYISEALDMAIRALENERLQEELEQIKEEIKNKKDGYGKYPVCDNCIKIINMHISKLKGESKE